ncbi:kelch domain-containing protein 1 [Quercus suber]|uniref:Kelch domain-containing protein 1 n=1 Tax=Quercus suber TaxID=58331 RepID=A0AAW0KW21_QUESU
MELVTYLGQGRGGVTPATPLKVADFSMFLGYGRDNCQTNQVHVFDTANQTWSQPAIKGTPPTPRDSHSCTTVGDNLFVFGERMG